MTGFWCELMSDTKVLQKNYVARNRKVLAIIYVFLGGFMARALIGRIGAAATLGIGTIMRFLVAVAWLFGPAKASKSN